MTNTDIAIPVHPDCHVRLAIVSNHQPEERWQQQLELLRSAGAHFEDGSWYLWIEGSSLTAPRLEPLWRAALDYGTHIRIEAIQPQPPS